MESLGVSTVYDIYEDVSIFEIIGPVRSQPTLSTDIPNVKLKNPIKSILIENLKLFVLSLTQNVCVIP